MYRSDEQSGGWPALKAILCKLLNTCPDNRCTVSEAAEDLQKLLEEMKAHHVL